jgi:hypothetical protein
MDRIAATEYHKTLTELFAELQQATTPELRAPILARMHNILFPLYVVDTEAAQHAAEAFAKLKHPDLAIVNAAHGTIGESLARFRRAIDEHPDEPFVVYGDVERAFVRPVSRDELAGVRTHGRLLAHDHGPYVHAFDATPKVERVLRGMEPAILRPAFERMGFTKPEALAFFTTRAHPKLGKPAERIPSLTVCSMRAGIPVQLVRVHEF